MRRNDTTSWLGTGDAVPRDVPIDAIIVLGLLAVAFAFFIFDWLAPDVVALGVLSVLVLSGVVTPSEAFQGFSSGAVVTIAGLMIIGSGLARTGVVRWVARGLEKIVRDSERRMLLLNTTIPGALSGFINIVAAASFFIPVILRLSRRLHVAPSKILLPMACCALIGANLTLIGASHNLVVDGILRDETGAGLAFFEVSPVGLSFLVLAVVYIFFAGRHLLPARQSSSQGKSDAPDLMEVYDLETRLQEVRVYDLGNTGMRLGDLQLEREGLSVLAVARGDDQVLVPEPEVELCEDDLLLVQGRSDRVEIFVERHDALELMGSPSLHQAFAVSNAELAEAVVPPRSPYIGQRIEALGLRDTYGVLPIAHFRGGSPRRTSVGAIKLQEGDSILFYGPRGRVHELDPERELLVYYRPGKPEVSRAARRRAPWAALILVSTVLPAAVGWFPISVTATVGALLMLLLGVVPVERVYDAIEGRTLVLISGIYPLGLAINESGAGGIVGGLLVHGLGALGPVAVMAGIAVLAMALTQPIHNAAVAVIMTPIAIDAARTLESSPRAFSVAVLVACSTTFLMPYGHPAPYLVQTPGAYTSVDYLKFGSGLIVIALAVIIGGVPMLWPL